MNAKQYRLERIAAGLCRECGAKRGTRKTICDDCAGIMRGRIAALYAARIAAGNCYHCNRPREHYAARCDSCTVKQREKLRKKLGMKPWEAGKRGRPPIVA